MLALLHMCVHESGTPIYWGVCCLFLQWVWTVKLLCTGAAQNTVEHEHAVVAMQGHLRVCVGCQAQRCMQYLCCVLSCHAHFA